eukprot:CAMPEP_0201579846 /NCGR_PEP_ID=MMETSP0190_2-20130828/27729_1 /ASSEMBLY_ACC=CAM_ASM_000263 /TAXON_ID=37353 /ORGANISM="Rosalina sp." /LENGTH=346 /DNA_ID=CAMNT_0048014875 /DNA_START=105 /DNA_END=1146 /DNA_ORIENTATION=+
MATLAIITASIFALVNGRRGGYERPFRNIEYGSNGGGYVEGFVTHGVNNYNGERIVDLISTGFGQSWDTPIYEQQVLNTNGPNAELITASTDRNTELAMGRFFTDALGSVGSITPNEDLFNQPYYDVGTITQSSLSIDDRSIPISFDNIPSDPSIAFGNSYLPDSVNPNPTLAEWEEGSGLIEIDCNNGIADVTISVCNLLPEALYTVWEVGISNPGPNEAAYWYPAGGLGNVIRTDENGNGELNINMPWCPVRECIPDSSTDCQIYFSVFHHNDYIVWGGDAAGLFWKPISYPAGIVGSNHLWFPLFGENLQDPLNDIIQMANVEEIAEEKEEEEEEDTEECLIY